MALRDADRFNRQKVKDVKDILTNYCIMQIDRCKKVRPKRTIIKSLFNRR